MEHAIINAKTILIAIGLLDSLGAGGPKKQKEAAATFVTTASKGLVSRAFELVRARLGAPVKLDLALGHLGQHRRPVLNAQAFDFPMPQVFTKANKLAPRRGQPVSPSGPDPPARLPGRVQS